MHPPFVLRLFDSAPAEGENVMPFARNDELARPWIRPGTPGLEHRIGGIEKQPGTGNIDYSPSAHQKMTEIRHQKVANVADSIPESEYDNLFIVTVYRFGKAKVVRLKYGKESTTTGGTSK